MAIGSMVEFSAEAFLKSFISHRAIVAIVVVCAQFTGVLNAEQLSPESERASEYIVGGTESTRGDWPFIVALVDPSAPNIFEGQFCAGSLIHRNWVVTAAHCVDGRSLSNIRIATGLHDLISDVPTDYIAPRRLLKHPSYNSTTSDYDIALIELSSPSNASTVRITLDDPGGEAPQGTGGTTIGWGVADTSYGAPYYPTALREIWMPVVTNGICIAAMGALNAVTSRMICSGWDRRLNGGCFGDSGGPMVNRWYGRDGHWYLTGVVSWGAGDCGDVSKGYSVYARVSALREFIYQYIPELLKSDYVLAGPLFLLLGED